MSTAKVASLELQIEELVRGHVAMLRASAAAAVERAFERAVVRGTRGRGAASPATKTSGQRRAPQELAALAERLYAVICARPGAAITTLAAEIGVSPRELGRPALQLKRAGRLRTVGQRQGTRYFPMTAKVNATRA